MSLQVRLVTALFLRIEIPFIYKNNFSLLDTDPESDCSNSKCHVEPFHEISEKDINEFKALAASPEPTNANTVEQKRSCSPINVKVCVTNIENDILENNDNSDDRTLTLEPKFDDFAGKK